MDRVPYVVPVSVIAVFLAGLAVTVSVGSHAQEQASHPATQGHVPASTKPSTTTTAPHVQPKHP
jgi:hypothetical protein